MPIFEIQGPDGKTYEADAPDAQTAAGAFAPKAPDTSAASRINAPVSGFNKGLANVAGLPLDTLANVLDLGKAGIGSIVGAARGGPNGPGPIPDALQVNSDRSGIPLSGQWFQKWLNKIGVETEARNPSDPVQRYGQAAGEAIPGAVGQGPGGAVRSVGASMAAQAAADLGLPTEVQIGAQMLGNKTGISDATRAALKTGLESLEARAAPRVKADLADAQSVAPNGQTVAQTTASPFLAKIGQGAAGGTTAESSASQVDKLTRGLIQQAKDIAPVGVSHPEVASNVQKAVQAKDDEIASRADAVYASGRSAATKQGSGQTVATSNTVSAVDQMLAAANDPRNLAPPQVTKRLQALINTLRPSSAPKPGLEALGGTPATNPGGTSWGGFYDLRKQINTLFDEVPSDSITPAMNATFSQLKKGYYADLSSAPDGPAKAVTQKANDIYSGLQDQRETLKNSVVASILGKDGKTSIADPDAVLKRITAMDPSAAKYARDMLEQYSPDTLDQLRAFAITKHVQEAARSGQAATVSDTNPRALAPGKLADSGLFTAEQAKELRSRESALNTALTALPEKGAPVAEIDPQSAGRLVGGGFNPTFLAGAASRVLTAGKLERALNTPEGRNKILGIQDPGAKPQSQDVAKVSKMYQSALAAQMAQDRQQAQ